MKRVLTSIPIFLLLLPWLALTGLLLWAGVTRDPCELLLLIPGGIFVGGAGYIHRWQTKLGKDFVACVAASTMLAGPWLLILVLSSLNSQQRVRYEPPRAPVYVPPPPPQPVRQVIEAPPYEPVIVEQPPIQGWLGVKIETLGASDERSVGLAKGGGVLIAGLQEDRPAQDAGFQPGDIIVKFDGVRILASEQLRESIQATAPSKRVRVRAMRGNRDITLKPTIESKYGERGCAPWPCY